MQKDLRIIELFSGIGAQKRGVEQTGLFNVIPVATSEIDRDATISYAAIHHGLTNELIDNYADYPSLEEMRDYLTKINLGYVPEKDLAYNWYKSGKKFERYVKTCWLACKLNNNLGDVSRIEKLPETDVLFTSSPCQSISVAGKLAGLNPDDNTRSSLIWQNIRLLNEYRNSNELPKYIFLENVKNLVGKRFLKDFEIFNQLIESFGYNTYWKVINAKDTGIPQNRERVFAVYVRKDIDTKNLTWPVPFDNGIRLKDVLDTEVDESYYINTQKAQGLIQKLLDDGIIGNDTTDNDE